MEFTGGTVLEAGKLVAVIAGIYVIGRALRKGQLGALTFENGKLSLEARQNARDDSRYYRGRRIDEVDRWLDLECREITRLQKKPLKRALRSDQLCQPALAAIVPDLLYSLYEAVNQNDFKHKLAQNNRASYRAEKVELIRQEYEEFLDDSGDVACSDTANPTVYPTWAEIEPHIKRMVDAWSGQIADKVIEACGKKLEVYAEYSDIKDAHEAQVIASCIEKNLGYIKSLGGANANA